MMMMMIIVVIVIIIVIRVYNSKHTCICILFCYTLYEQTSCISLFHLNKVLCILPRKNKFYYKCYIKVSQTGYI